MSASIVQISCLPYFGRQAKLAPPLLRGGREGFSSPQYLTTIFLTLTLLTCIPPASADTLGRLFFTPQQRAQLDYAYARSAPAEGSASPILTVNGIVQKQGGPRTVWVNGVAQSVANNGERNPTTQTVTVPGTSHPIKIKVGEKILLDQPVPATQETSAP